MNHNVIEREGRRGTEATTVLHHLLLLLLTLFSVGDAVTSKKGRRVSLKIVHRFHFSSSLKRMSVISSFVPAQASGHTHLVTVKGAPEVVKEMVNSQKIPIL